MLIKTLPKLTVSDTIDDFEDVVLDFYKGLGWNGVDSLNVKKARMNKNDYIKIADELKKLGKDNSERNQIVMTWANYAPSVDDDIKEGTVKLLEGIFTK